MRSLDCYWPLRETLKGMALWTTSEAGDVQLISVGEITVAGTDLVPNEHVVASP